MKWDGTGIYLRMIKDQTIKKGFNIKISRDGQSEGW
jgi:hypothetical protein